MYYSYTAVGVFVLGRMFREAWGSQAKKKQAEFNEFLEVNLERDDFSFVQVRLMKLCKLFIRSSVLMHTLPFYELHTIVMYFFSV